MSWSSSGFVRRVGRRKGIRFFVGRAFAGYGKEVGTLARLGLFDEASGALALQGIKKPEHYRPGFFWKIFSQ